MTADPSPARVAADRGRTERRNADSWHPTSRHAVETVPPVPAPTPDGQTGTQGRGPATIASIVRALEATYTDEGVDIWLTSENALTGGIPLHRLGRATGRDLVAAAVASVDGCDPRDPEFSR